MRAMRPGERPSSSATICRIAARACAEIDLPGEHGDAAVRLDAEISVHAIGCDRAEARPRAAGERECDDETGRAGE
jgi:hypothetical protein